MCHSVDNNIIRPLSIIISIVDPVWYIAKDSYFRAVACGDNNV